MQISTQHKRCVWAVIYRLSVQPFWFNINFDSKKKASKIPIEYEFCMKYYIQAISASEAMATEDGAEFDFRPRVAFGQDDFNQLLVQVM